MLFGRKQNNPGRSNQPLDGPAPNLIGVPPPPISSSDAAAATAPPALSGAAAATANDPNNSSASSLTYTSEFDARAAQQLELSPQPPPPPPHIFTTGAGAQQLHNPTASGSPVFGQRTSSRNPPDFDSVARSQSQRYTPGSTHNQNQYPPASSSADDLTNPPNLVPLPGQPEKRSTRRLIKNILTGSSRSGSEQNTPQSSYDNTGGLARRPSKRVSNPPILRPGISLASQVSQVSLDQQQVDWQSQGPHTQPSPLGEIEEHFFEQNSNRELHLQNPQDPPFPSIRRVPTDQETSPHSLEELAFHQQQAHAAQLQALQEQRLYGQAPFDTSQQQYLYANPEQSQYAPIFTQHLGNRSQHNTDAVSQLSHDSPVTDSDQRSATLQSAQNSPAVNFAVAQDHPLPPNPPLAQQSAPSPQAEMAPPPAGPPPNRRSQETDKALRGQGEPPPGPPSTFRLTQQQTMNPLPQPPPSAGGQNPNYRSGSAQDRGAQYEASAAGDQGRASPQPNPDRDQDPEKAFKDLLTKYKNVKRLYFDGKTQIEQLSGQVEQLQNAIANQRMSQSRTALDDNEYTTRFNRLNGAINNLSFNIRKDWRTVPSWLEKSVSTEALKTGKQEMTAIGRAVITRWIMEEIFNTCFHPGLNVELSRQLKEIEMNIRRLSYTMNSQEEYDALTAKVVSWRMATLEGLQLVLNSQESAENRADFTKMAVSNLTAHLFQFLTDPPPTGVDGSASMIVELAVGIASNLPLESRDVAITYPLPLDPLRTDIMEVEKTPLPPLESQKEGERDGDGQGEDSGDGKDKASSKDRRVDKTRSGMLTTMLGGPPPGRKGSNALSVPPMNTDKPPPPALSKDANRIRLAGFLAVEVRGRQVLVKAPVWTLG